VVAQRLPYPHAPSKKDKERQYARFLELFKKLQIDIPFSEALEQMPVYAKFMKDILSKKRRVNDEETIQIDANCSAIIQRTLPKKEQDPGRVTLPVAIGTTHVGKALLDLGSSINLMPFDRSLASAPNTIEVVKLSIPRGLFLTSIIQLRYRNRMYNIYFVLPLGSIFGLILIKSRNRK